MALLKRKNYHLVADADQGKARQSLSNLKEKVKDGMEWNRRR